MNSLLKNFVFPVFKKNKKDIIPQIKEEQKTETMKDITEQYELIFFNIITKEIETENYIKIDQEETYEMHFHKNDNNLKWFLVAENYIKICKTKKIDDLKLLFREQ